MLEPPPSRVFERGEICFGAMMLMRLFLAARLCNRSDDSCFGGFLALQSYPHPKASTSQEKHGGNSCEDVDRSDTTFTDPAKLQFVGTLWTFVLRLGASSPAFVVPLSKLFARLISLLGPNKPDA
jgi:hypothetical protein